LLKLPWRPAPEAKRWAPATDSVISDDIPWWYSVVIATDSA
jgi:hypothetical protein